jgi:hypothetical protein
MDRSNHAAELCQNRNNTVAAPGFSCPNPMPHPFDTETGSDPDPDLASPLTFSDDLQIGTGLRLPPRCPLCPLWLIPFSPGATWFWDGLTPLPIVESGKNGTLTINQRGGAHGRQEPRTTCGTASMYSKNSVGTGPLARTVKGMDGSLSMGEIGMILSRQCKQLIG